MNITGTYHASGDAGGDLGNALSSRQVVNSALPGIERLEQLDTQNYLLSFAYQASSVDGYLSWAGDGLLSINLPTLGASLLRARGARIR